MINKTGEHFPLPENARTLNIKELTELFNNDEFLNHYVINKSYHEYNEIIKYENEVQRLEELLDEIKEICQSLSDIDDSLVSSNILKVDETNSSLRNQLHYLNTELTGDNITAYLEVYLAKIQKLQIDPLKDKISQDPYNVENHTTYIDVVTKFNKLKTLFKSLDVKT